MNRPAGGETAKVGNLALMPPSVGLSRFMVIRGQIQAMVLTGSVYFQLKGCHNDRTNFRLVVSVTATEIEQK